jgi:prepilin-type N-terminal cleavage/methylation domain-containing protein
MTKSKDKSQKAEFLGFSLIELLVTITLISLLSGVGFVSFVSYSRRQTVNQAALNIKQTIDLARFNALSFVKPPSCESDEQLESYRVNFCALNAICQSGSPEVDYEVVVVCGGGQNVVATAELPGDVSMEDVQGGDNCRNITFNVLASTNQGVPCQLNVVGFDNQIPLSIDSVGNASL